MKKIILVLFLVVSFLLGRTQKIDSIYVADSVDYIADIDHAYAVGKATKTQIVFQQNLNVLIKVGDSSILFIVERAIGKGESEDGSSILRSYSGSVLGNPYILATREDNGVLYSVGLCNFVNLYIYYIKPSLKTL